LALEIILNYVFSQTSEVNLLSILKLRKSRPESSNNRSKGNKMRANSNAINEYNLTEISAVKKSSNDELSPV
jgi:hypothetical protein